MKNWGGGHLAVKSLWSCRTDLPHGVDDVDLALTRDLLQQETHRAEQPAPLCCVPRQYIITFTVIFGFLLFTHKNLNNIVV